MKHEPCGRCKWLTEGYYKGHKYPCICGHKNGGFPIKPSELDMTDGLCPKIKAIEQLLRKDEKSEG